MFQKIEGPWPRQAHFRHYMDNVRCTYSLTVSIDVTALRAALKAGGFRAYPAQIHMLATAVNRLPAFRMGLSPAGEPGHWSCLHPGYTVFHPRTETFSSLWTAYQADFRAFYKACVADMAQYADADAFAPKPGMPPNVFDVSSVPWVDFTAFNLNVYAEGTHLSPIFTLGRYVERDGKTWLPLAMQLHHAACDGFHAGQLVQAVRDLAQTPGDWL